MTKQQFTGIAFINLAENAGSMKTHHQGIGLWSQSDAQQAEHASSGGDVWDPNQ